MFSLLATTHDPENRFRKLNEIHRRRLSNWNHHTDSLTFVASSHHCHQALAMINIATNDSLVDWIILWALTIQFCWSKHWGYSFICELSLSDWFMSDPTAFSVTQMDVRKSRKYIIGQKIPYPNLNLVVEKLWSELQRLVTRLWFPFTDRTFVLLELSSGQVVWKGTQHTHNNGAVWM